jgi:O-methyltransferase
MKRSIRDFVLRNSRHLGDRFAENIINIGYLVKTSNWLEKVDAHIEQDRNRFYEHILTSQGLADTPFTYLEFGVSKGVSLAWWVDHARHPDCRFVGFDTFEGLPEDWGNIPKGAYSAGGKMPDIQDERVSYQVGLFQDTLPGFLPEEPMQEKLVVHLDADLYNSTLFPLVHLAPHLKSGDVLIFDEFFAVSKCSHEFRAWLDYLSLYKTDYEGIAKNKKEFAVKLL